MLPSCIQRSSSLERGTFAHLFSRPFGREETHVDLVVNLLVLNPADRLGGRETGVQAVLSHAFFEPENVFDEPPLWQRKSPFTPVLKHEMDTSNFDMNVLAKAKAERMRSQLEQDDGEEVRHENANPLAQIVKEEVEEDEGDEDEGDSMSFKTVNAVTLARMQLSDEHKLQESQENDSPEGSHSVIALAGEVGVG